MEPTTQQDNELSPSNDTNTSDAPGEPTSSSSDNLTVFVDADGVFLGASNGNGQNVSTVIVSSEHFGISAPMQSMEVHGLLPNQAMSGVSTKDVQHQMSITKIIAGSPEKFETIRANAVLGFDGQHATVYHAINSGIFGCYSHGRTHQPCGVRKRCRHAHHCISCGHHHAIQPAATCYRDNYYALYHRKKSPQCARNSSSSSSCSSSSDDCSSSDDGYNKRTIYRHHTDGGFAVCAKVDETLSPKELVNNHIQKFKSTCVVDEHHIDQEYDANWSSEDEDNGYEDDSTSYDIDYTIDESGIVSITSDVASCNACGKDLCGKGVTCANCSMASYCNKACQKTDWVNHHSAHCERINNASLQIKCCAPNIEDTTIPNMDVLKKNAPTVDCNADDDKNDDYDDQEEEPEDEETQTQYYVISSFINPNASKESLMRIESDIEKHVGPRFSFRNPIVKKKNPVSTEPSTSSPSPKKKGFMSKLKSKVFRRGSKKTTVQSEEGKKKSFVSRFKTGARSKMQSAKLIAQGMKKKGGQVFRRKKQDILRKTGQMKDTPEALESKELIKQEKERLEELRKQQYFDEKAKKSGRHQARYTEKATTAARESDYLSPAAQERMDNFNPTEEEFQRLYGPTGKNLSSDELIAKRQLFKQLHQYKLREKLLEKEEVSTQSHITSSFNNAQTKLLSELGIDVSLVGPYYGGGGRYGGGRSGSRSGGFFGGGRSRGVSGGGAVQVSPVAVSRPRIYMGTPGSHRRPLMMSGGGRIRPLGRRRNRVHVPSRLARRPRAYNDFLRRYPSLRSDRWRRHGPSVWNIYNRFWSPYGILYPLYDWYNPLPVIPPQLWLDEVAMAAQIAALSASYPEMTRAGYRIVPDYERQRFFWAAQNEDAYSRAMRMSRLRRSSGFSAYTPFGGISLF